MIRGKLTSKNVYVRILWFAILFLVIFFGATIISHYILPEGLLKNANTTRDFDISSNIWLAALKIFSFNLISVVVIMIGSIFANKNNENEEYLSIAYICFIVLVLINGVTLGTWSFSTDAPSIPIIERITSMFQITEHAGLLEMFGQLLITCVMADKYIVMTYKKQTITRHVRDVLWTKKDILLLLLGIILMFVGAWIESRSLMTIG